MSGLFEMFAVMWRWCFAVAGLLTDLGAGELVLFDIDYSGRQSEIGSAIEFGGGPYPGRSTCTRINFGAATIGVAPESLSDTAALLESFWDGEEPFAYSQLELQLIAGGVYAFQKHRLELWFQFPSPELTEAGDGFSIRTDGAVTYGLDFYPDGRAELISNVRQDSPIWGERVVQESSVAGHFDISQPVHLVWELDQPGHSTSVTINGETYTRTDLAVQGPGLRNGGLYPGPGWIRLTYDDTGEKGLLAIRSIKVTGSVWDGPLIMRGPDLWGSEKQVVVLPLDTPETGQWQPEYSHDGGDWIPFAVPLEHADEITGFACGCLVAPKTFVRLRVVP